MKLLPTQDYQPVAQRESAGSVQYVQTLREPSVKITSQNMWRMWTCWFPWTIVLCLALTNWYTWRRYSNAQSHEGLFSPASSAIKYRNIVFQAAVDSDSSPYQGAVTEESEKLWQELHKYGVSRIPMSQAAQLANRTSPIPGDDGQYVVILEVFHQLHCLNHVRRRLFWNSTTSPDDDEALSMKHLDHCIDSLRQSLMCSADVTPLPYVWWRKYNRLLPASAVTHTCRDFDALRDWAKEHRAGKIDPFVQVHDPLGEQVVYDV